MTSPTGLMTDKVLRMQEVLQSADGFLQSQEGPHRHTEPWVHQTLLVEVARRILETEGIETTGLALAVDFYERTSRSLHTIGVCALNYEDPVGDCYPLGLAGARGWKDISLQSFPSEGDWEVSELPLHEDTPGCQSRFSSQLRLCKNFSTDLEKSLQQWVNEIKTKQQARELERDTAPGRGAMSRRFL